MKSERVSTAVGTTLASYLRFCAATTRWSTSGGSDLEAALKDGPVVLLLWHSRLLLVGPRWPRDQARLAVLHDVSPVGRAAGAAKACFGLDPVAMSSKSSNRVASRRALRLLRTGHSIGLTVDGPLGPAHVIKDAALDWPRITGRPVFVHALAVRRQKRLSSWDRMMLPLPFTRGACVFRRWPGTIDRDPCRVARDELRRDMSSLLVQAAAEADAMVGLAPGP